MVGMNRRYIFNVLVGGISIGMTFNRNEAANWLAQSMFLGKKEIVPVPYQVEPKQRSDD